MTQQAIVVVGGVYHEQCTWPEWDHYFGSGGRAAIALVSHVEHVKLLTYAHSDVERLFRPIAEWYKFELETSVSQTGISFEYVHCMSTPIIRPALSHIPAHDPIFAQEEVVLRFGMLEGSGRVDAEWCVYDPQSAFNPERFEENGSRAKHLAIVANRSEIIAMAGISDPNEAAAKLLENDAEVVVVKSGAEGAWVHTRTAPPVAISAFRSELVWTIGSGDVFAAIFAAQWAVHRLPPVDAAHIASRAVAVYAETMALPAAPAEDLVKGSAKPAMTKPGRVYLASPFFNLGQRWLVDEARRGLTELGLDVFSPIHDVGPGPAEVVAPADLAALDTCDRVFAILDGLDTGTVFEVGFARAQNKPVYALAQSVSEENLKMVTGSGCAVFQDFVTALHHTAWKA